MHRVHTGRVSVLSPDHTTHSHSLDPTCDNVSTVFEQVHGISARLWSVLISGTHGFAHLAHFAVRIFTKCVNTLCLLDGLLSESPPAVSMARFVN